MACLGVNASFAQNEVVTNQTVIDLFKEGFEDADIIGLIENSSDRTITMDITQMRALKEAGAGTELMQFLQKIAKTDHGYEGVLWWNPTDGGKPKKLYRTSFERETRSATGAVLAIGAAVAAPNSMIGSGVGRAATTALLTTSGGMKKLVMKGANARVVMTGENGRKPVFRFIFPKKEVESFAQSEMAWFYYFMNEIESPNEFQCIKMTEKKNKRTFPDGFSYSVAGFTSTNTSSKNIISFEINSISNNTFEVTFPEELEPGEYCFFYKNGTNNKYFSENVFGFDFSVQ